VWRSPAAGWSPPRGHTPWWRRRWTEPGTPPAHR